MLTSHSDSKTGQLVSQGEASQSAGQAAVCTGWFRLAGVGCGPAICLALQVCGLTAGRAGEGPSLSAEE